MSVYSHYHIETGTEGRKRESVLCSCMHAFKIHIECDILRECVWICTYAQLSTSICLFFKIFL